MALPLSESHRQKLENAKLLVVGAGGIGCELLKNLALAGFKNIETVDLDTIDVSNLNRQFLFQKKHVGQSKALVAAEAVKTLVGAENIDIIPHKANIFEENYSKAYFAKFDLILNALDNLKARRHVNRLCISADKPLIESGSAGYLGQAYPIVKGKTECFDCKPKPRQKTYPACTIRNTPSEPVHCIVWAKYLFNQLFGEEDADQDVAPEQEAESTDNDAAATNGKMNGDASESRGDGADKVEKVSMRHWAMKVQYKPKLIFQKLYQTDVETLLSMKDLWKKRAPPKVVQYDDADCEEPKVRSVPTLPQLVKIFNTSLSALKERAQTSEDPLSWDKDDQEALDFVIAAANLRCMVFNIDLKSAWDVKSIAGNIIPAIASTNAMCAGLIVLQAVNLLIKGSTTYREATVQNIGPKRIMTGMMEPPVDGCYICKDQARATVVVDFKKTTLKEFKEKLLQGDLSMINPDGEIGGTVVIDSEDPDEDMLAKQLCQFSGFVNGAIMKVDDFSQDFEIELTLLAKTEEHEFEENFKIVNATEKSETATDAPTEANETPTSSGNTQAVKAIAITDDVVTAKKKRTSNDAKLDADAHSTIQISEVRIEGELEVSTGPDAKKQKISLE